MKRTLTTLAVLVASPLALTACEQRVSYQSDVRPILEDRCIGCHQRGDEGYEASGFSVESYCNVMAGTRFGPVIDPGSRITSSLQRMIEGATDRAIHMPRDQATLTEDEIETIGLWIDQGALGN
jgi:uncharacterized membrane protein